MHSQTRAELESQRSKIQNEIKETSILLGKNQATQKDLLERIEDLTSTREIQKELIINLNKELLLIKKEIKHVNKWREVLFKKFKEMKIEVNEGSANFLLMNFDRVKINSLKVFIKLANAGILVRNMNNYGIRNSLRVTIGKAKENEKFTSKLRKIINV